MLVPIQPANESERIAALRSLNILDTPPEERFDRLTRLAKRVFGVPIALVSLVDENRQWFKSCNGLKTRETSRDVSFCAHAIVGSDVLIVPDARADFRFHDNPLVVGQPFIRFYAGYPLGLPNGEKLGTLCLIDEKPRAFGEEERRLLRDLGRMAEQEIAALQLATIDELTLLSNRRGFEALAQHALNVCKRLARPATLLVFDLTGFRAINDTYGHAEGDRALQTFSEALREVFDESDVIARLGGDEFGVLLTDAGLTETEALVERVRAAVGEREARVHRGYRIEFAATHTPFDPASHRAVADLLPEED
ncbi:sensor domain-containing diguanylate cyclase [Caballeronia sp. Lep1P3]|uniref:GGDEF domain-containing protein n=1 Tax=Caballeronia sp. Lep1P3 TaxID=2878150 RepID=UPI001FD5C95A|nr:sensor domain-containing diguanylate cyclase [Caballeronia sp. Lep1P3]